MEHPLHGVGTPKSLPTWRLLRGIMHKFSAARHGFSGHGLGFCEVSMFAMLERPFYTAGEQNDMASWRKSTPSADT